MTEPMVASLVEIFNFNLCRGGRRPASSAPQSERVYCAVARSKEDVMSQLRIAAVCLGVLLLVVSCAPEPVKEEIPTYSIEASCVRQPGDAGPPVRMLLTRLP